MTLKLVRRGKEEFVFRGEINKWGNPTYSYTGDLMSTNVKFKPPAGLYKVECLFPGDARIDLRNSSGSFKTGWFVVEHFFRLDGNTDFWCSIDSSFEGEDFIMILTPFQSPPPRSKRICRRVAKAVGAWR